MFLIHNIHFVLLQDVRMVDPNFMKIFKLAQLSIEYLLVSEKYYLYGETSRSMHALQMGLKMKVH